MRNLDYTIFIEINNLKYIFFVGKNDEYDNFKIS